MFGLVAPNLLSRFGVKRCSGRLWLHKCDGTFEDNSHRERQREQSCYTGLHHWKGCGKPKCRPFLSSSLCSVHVVSGFSIVKCHGMAVVSTLAAFHDCIAFAQSMSCQKKSCYENTFVSDFQHLFFEGNAWSFSLSSFPNLAAVWSHSYRMLVMATYCRSVSPAPSIHCTWCQPDSYFVSDSSYQLLFVHLLLCSFSIMARKTLFDWWKSVRSPVNISRWRLGRFCHDKVATCLWLTVVRSSVGVVAKGFIPRRPKRGVLTGGDFSKLAVFVPGKCSFLQTGEHWLVHFEAWFALLSLSSDGSLGTLCDPVSP